MIGESGHSINSTVISNDMGLFPVTEGAKIGDWNQPLVFDDLRITCSGGSSCGLIGRASDGQTSVIVKNGDMSTSEAIAVGGLIGKVTDGSYIGNSKFQGKIVAGNSPSVGGLVGEIDFTGSEQSLDIDRSGVELEFIQSASTTGGLIGKVSNVSGNHKINIEESYVYFDLAKTNSVGPDIIGGNSAALIGLNNGLDINLGAVIIDYSVADLPNSFFQVVAGGSSGTLNLKDMLYNISGGQTSSFNNANMTISGNGGALTLSNQAELGQSFSNNQDNHHDFMMGHDPKIVLRWEYCLDPRTAFDDRQCHDN